MTALRHGTVLALLLVLTASAGPVEWNVGMARARGHDGVRVSLGTPVRWSRFLPDAYAPRVMQPAGWRASGRPVVLLLVQHGAAAEEALVLTQDGRGEARMMRVALGDALAVTASPEGRAMLVRDWRGEGAAPRRECLDWNGSTVVPANCP